MRRRNGFALPLALLVFGVLAVMSLGTAMLSSQTMTLGQGYVDALALQQEAEGAVAGLVAKIEADNEYGSNSESVCETLPGNSRREQSWSFVTSNADESCNNRDGEFGEEYTSGTVTVPAGYAYLKVTVRDRETQRYATVAGLYHFGLDFTAASASAIVLKGVHGTDVLQADVYSDLSSPAGLVELPAITVVDSSNAHYYTRMSKSAVIGPDPSDVSESQSPYDFISVDVPALLESASPDVRVWVEAGTVQVRGSGVSASDFLAVPPASASGRSS